MRRCRAGYTLLELIVVMSLMGIVFFFTVPRFGESFFIDDAKRSSRGLIAKLQSLREEALRTHRQQILNIDVERSRFWETSALMTPEETELALRRAQFLPGGGRVVGVDFPYRGRVTAGQTQIRFFPDGSSDRALVHLMHGDATTSFLVEPFLSQVKIFDSAVGFEDVRL
jgi:prepilin-type N-terminal cleavage/methylation domain-containing protein